MKSVTSFVINIIYSVLLSVCLPMCIASSFNIKFNVVVLIAAAVIFSMMNGFLAEALGKNKYLIAAGIIQTVFIITIIFNFELILNQLEYALNKVLAVYSQYISLPSSINISQQSTPSKDATVIFTAFTFLISELSAITLFRLRRNIIIYIMTFVFLLPCFILVNTLPNIILLIIVLSLNFSLYITAYTRTRAKTQGSIMTSIAALILACIMISLNMLCPEKGFERFDWQWDLLNIAQEVTGVGASNNEMKNLLNISKSNVKKTENLATLTDFKLTGTKIMEVKAEHSGTLYLKGTGYADYNDNKWTIITEAQAGKYPIGFDAFTMLTAGNDVKTAEIKTSGVEKVIFSPYNLAENKNTSVADSFIINDNKDEEYSLKYYPESKRNNVALENEEYSEFVNDIYLQLPKETKQSLTEIADENNLIGEKAEDTAKKVKAFVSKTADYSVTPKKMPNDEDFAVWFLQDAETGYCVHFATAATTMLRAIGVPARYVTGYVTTAKENEWVTVTSDNAHAWAEYYDTEKGWVPLEATPSAFTTSTNAEIRENSTPPTSIPTVAVSTSAPTKNNTHSDTQKQTHGTGNSNKSHFPVGATIAVIVIIILLVFVLRVKVCENIRHKRFFTGRNNSRVIYIYRYILKLSVHGCIPEDIQQIADEAKFSNHRVSDEQVRIMFSYSQKQRRNLFKDCNRFKKLYYRLWRAL